MAEAGSVVAGRWAGRNRPEDEGARIEDGRGAALSPAVGGYACVPRGRRGTRRPAVTRRPVASPGAVAGARQVVSPRPDARSCSEMGTLLARRKFFWRRVLVVMIIGGLGALAWNAAERLVSVADGRLTSSDLCSPGLGNGQVQMVALASAESPVAPAGDGGPPLELRGGDQGACSQVYVARPGDTLWAIATKFAHGGDPRALADSLEAQIGGVTLQPGERLAVP